MTENKREDHNETQGKYFDQAYAYFCQAIPADVQARLGKIVAQAQLDAQARVLDVGCGVGALFPFFLDLGVNAKNITGCDLSGEMLSQARTRYPDAKFWQGDVIDFPKSFGLFDAVFFNACFGNIFDQTQALAKARDLLLKDGRIVISHPMGAIFVQKLHENEPQIVPHLLPDENDFQEFADALGLSLSKFVSEANLYIAVLQVA